MLEFLSLGSHSSKGCPAKKEKVQVNVLQAHVALAWSRPDPENDLQCGATEYPGTTVNIETAECWDDLFDLQLKFLH